MVLVMVRAGQVSGDQSSGGRLTDHIELGVLARAFPGIYWKRSWMSRVGGRSGCGGFPRM